MSILIKGMDMPKSCYNHCDFIAFEFCPLKDYIESHNYKSSTHPDCPLIEIPTPHGRLIDKDELLSHLSKDPLFDLVERYGVSGVIESRPTILEAEE